MRLLRYLAATCTVTAVMWADGALAQRRPIADDSLGNERSIVTPEGNIRGLPGDRITGGARRGNNLFHSFREFGIDAGRAVYFDAPGVQTILSRVTGGNPSEIYGRLGVLGDANLFLINPSGILFGEGASLDVGGSFVGTTADAIQFGDQGFFNASVPNAPPLLTVQPSAFLFNQLNAAQITNYAGANTGVDDSAGASILGLRVPNGRSLLLVGGDVLLDREARLNALDGHVEVAGIAGIGTVGLSVNDNILRLTVPDGLARANVSLLNRSRIEVRGQGNGSVDIIARNVEISGSSTIRAGFREESTVTGEPGDITINATNSVNLTGSSDVGSSSLIRNTVGPSTATQGGNIRILTGSLLITDGARLDVNELGQGKLGDILINASDTVELRGVRAIDGRFMSALISNRAGGGSAQGGDIQIRARSLLVADGANLTASTRGQGNAGNISIEANTVEFSGFGLTGPSSNPDQINSGAYSQVLGGAGQESRVRGGDIRIETNSLLLTDSAVLSANVSEGGQGDAGNISITAERIRFTGEEPTIDEFPSSGIYSRVEAGGIGNGGRVTIRAGSLELSDGGVIRTDFSGNGDGSAGNIDIQSDRLSLFSNALIESDALGLGQAGNIAITSDIFRISGEAALSARTQGNGSGGKIRVSTGIFEARSGGQLVTTTSSQGDAGNIFVVADRITLSGFDPNYGDRLNQFDETIISNQGAASGLFANTAENSSGRGGTIRLRTGELDITDRARIVASSQGSGGAGDIRIRTNSLELTDNARLLADTRGEGDAGNVVINADTFEATDRGQVITTTDGSGQAGNIRIRTNSLELTDNARLLAESTGEGNAGNVIINANTFEATDGGQITTTTAAGSGQAGNITLNVIDRITLSSAKRGATSGLFANTSSSGRGGTIRLRTGELDITDRARIVASSQGDGVAGDINIAAQAVQLDEARITAETTTVDGGNITLQNLDLLLLQNGSDISATAGTDATSEAEGDGGNIDINADFIVAVPLENSDIRANAFVGNGGNVDITAEGIFGIDAREVETDLSDITASSEQGVQGTVNINQPDVDPSRGLAELPASVVDASDQIAQNCPTDGDVVGELGEFVVTGRGGLPANPAELLGGETVLTQLAEVDGTEAREQGSGGDDRTSTMTSPQTEMMEAQGWIVGADGKVMLTVESLAVEPHRSPNTPVPCPSS